MTTDTESLSASDGTVSDDDTITFSREDITDNDFPWFSRSSDEIIDAELVDEEKPGRRLKSDNPGSLDRPAASGVPKIDEWMHFFSRVLIRLATDYYIEWAFRGIDENALTDREVERIKLSDTERDRMARPFAEYSNKSKFMRKHGRMIVSSADSIDAIAQMGMWFSRVNRIAARHRRVQDVAVSRPVRAAPVFRPSPPKPKSESSANGSAESDVSSRSGPPPTIRPDHWRPDITGRIFNPSSGG